MSEHSFAGEVGAHIREDEAKRGRPFAIELTEGVLLAVVAVCTAWSGYQSALWDSRSAASYGQSSKLRIEAQGAAAAAGQQQLYDSTTFYAWLEAAQAGNTTLTDIIERRMRPEYKVAFDAWIKLDPLHNPIAPPGPAFMPEYHNNSTDDAARLNALASAAFDAGNHARDVGDEYVRVTVLLAVVLFLTAVSQRFAVRNVRLGVIGLAMLMLTFSLIQLVLIGL